MKIYRGAKKALIALLTFASLICLGTVAVSAEEITAERVEELIWADTLDKNPALQSILETDYVSEEIDAGEGGNVIGDLITPSECLRDYGSPQFYARLYVNEEYAVDNFEDAEKVMRENINDYDCYVCFENGALSEDGSAYEIGYSSSEGAVMYRSIKSAFFAEYQTIADVINEYGLGAVSGIRCFMNYGDAAVLVESDKGEYLIFKDAVVNKDGLYIGEAEERIEALTPVEPEEYGYFILRSEDYKERSERKLVELMKEAAPEIPTYDETVEQGITSRDTDCFSAYIGTENRYPDIDDGWAALTNQLSDRGIITGDSDGNFRPYDNVTRGEFAAMLCRLMSYERTETDAFSDIDGHWAEGYIGAVAQNGLMNGYDGGFDPDGDITYDEVFKTILHVLGYTEESTWMYGDYPIGTTYTAISIGLGDDFGSFDSSAPINRIYLACAISRALDTHMLSYGMVIDGADPSFKVYYDITLSDYLGGVSPVGIVFHSEEEQNDYIAQSCELFNELFGDIVDEYNLAMGFGYGDTVGIIGTGIRINPNLAARYTENA